MIVNTERTIGAYTVLLLVHHGIIDRGESRKAMDALGCDEHDMRRAIDRFDPRTVRPLSNTALRYGPEPKSKAKIKGQQDHPNRRDGEDGPERRCARCKKWFPATPEFFGFKNRESGALRSYCMPCWKER